LYQISNDPEVISSANKLILPGVGHFTNGMIKLNNSGIKEVLQTKVIDQKTPILGICLGMQLFTAHSEEGDVKGLGWFDAKTVRFNISDKKYKIPHMGWNSLIQKKDNHLLNNFDNDHLYYFVHSYHVVSNRNEDILATTEYGYEFVSAISKDNIYGVQFHPEKSHEWGEHILKNFLNL